MLPFAYFVKGEEKRMSNIKRKVSFYRLSITKYVENYAQIKTTKTSLSNEDVEKAFEKILSNMHKIEGGRYAQEVKTSSNKYIIEIISYSFGCRFA